MSENGLFTEIQLEGRNVRTHYHDEGEGENLLLIHGSGPGVSAWANWRLVYPILSKKYRLHAPDVIGFGYTDRPEGIQYSVDLFVKHMIAFIEQRNLGPLSIIGNSMGGALALQIAHRRPDLVKKLILMGSVGVSFPISEGLDAVWGYTPSVENMKRLIGMFSANPSMADNNDLVEMRYKASIQEGFQESFSALFPAPRQRHVDALALSEDELREIKHPSMLIHGREDRIIPIQETSFKLAMLLPDVELHMFSNCGHWTQIEQTDSFCKQVDYFLSK